MIPDLTSTLTRLAIDTIERGYVPDALTRWGMRCLLKQRLAALQQSGSSPSQVRNEFVRRLCDGPIAAVPEKANEQHYEVPSAFFAEVLGPRRKYSACYWPEGVGDLAAAEEAALRESCRHADLEDGMRVLELGCGWGALSLWILEQYPNCRVTAVSNSHSQREFILGQAQRRGLNDRLSVVTADMNDFDTSEQFDRVMSIEMFEHMQNYRRLLAKISGWLVDDGKLFVHVFCHQTTPYAFESRGPADWMARYFFSGGTMPSRDLFRAFNHDMTVAQEWTWNGRHYQRTLDAWLALLDDRTPAVLPILTDVYGKREARRWRQRWRMFFMACSELFGYAGGEEWFVAHYQFVPTRTMAGTREAELVEV